MGVAWGVEYGKTKHRSIDEYLDCWRTFCASGLCDCFVFPIDEILYEFKRGDDDQVSISTRDAPEILEQMRSLNCGDGTYDEFELISDGIDLYLPDLRGYRNIKKPESPWSYEKADSLEKLIGLSPRRSTLARQMREAAIFGRKHGMMIGVSF
jgi:hypothetical protein